MITPVRFIPIFYVALIGCKSSTDDKRHGPTTTIKSYTQLKQLPTFIKSYLYSNEKGKFIADKGEGWSAGCTKIEGEPDKQFISAISVNDTFRLKYWQGGFVKTSHELILLSDGQRVLDHLPSLSH